MAEAAADAAVNIGRKEYLTDQEKAQFSAICDPQDIDETDLVAAYLRLKANVLQN